MAVCHQLAICGQALQLPLGGVALHVVEYRGLQHEKGAVDPALTGLGLFVKTGDAIPFDFQMPEAAGGRTAVMVASLP